MIEIYTTNTCPNCKIIKKYMTEHDIEYVEKNTSTDSDAMSDLVSENIWSVPTIKYKGKYKTVHSVNELKDFIKE